MPEAVVFGAVAVPAVLLTASLYWLDRVRRREALFRWASAGGYKVLSYHQPVLTELSPFRVGGSKAQAVFRVEVEGTEGRRTGWVRLGSAWRGLTSDVAEVRWAA
jgi:hypothetical protein